MEREPWTQENRKARRIERRSKLYDLIERVEHALPRYREATEHLNSPRWTEWSFYERRDLNELVQSDDDLGLHLAEAIFLMKLERRREGDDRPLFLVDAVRVRAAFRMALQRRYDEVGALSIRMRGGLMKVAGKA